MTDAATRDIWPVRTALLAGMGAVTRLVIHAVLPTPAAVTTLVHLTIIAGLATTAAVLAVVLERTRPLLAVAFAIFCGAVAAGASWVAGGTAGLDDAEAWRLATAGVALGIAAPLFQAWRDNGGVSRTIPYPRAHDRAWTNLVLAAANRAFLAVC